MTTTQCPYCMKYFGSAEIEENRLNDLYKTNNTAVLAKGQLKILYEMSEDHKSPLWYVKEAKRIMEGLTITS
jgi:hypothetical protein